MSDSELDEELFGEKNNGGGGTGSVHVGAGAEMGQDEMYSEDRSFSVVYMEPPEYSKHIEFKRFTRENNVNVDNRYGYICTFLHRPFYFPG